MKLDALLKTEGALDEDEHSQFKQSDFNILKTDPGRTSLESILKEVQKLKRIRQIGLPLSLFSRSSQIVHHYRRRINRTTTRTAPSPAIRYTLIAAFCWQGSQEITDSLVELLVQIIHRLGGNAERRVEKQLIDDFKRGRWQASPAVPHC